MQVAIIGAGAVGSSIAAFMLNYTHITKVVLYARTIEKAKGKTLDLNAAASVSGILNGKTVFHPTASYSDIAGSDVIVVACGVPRSPGMSREDLIDINASLIGEIAVNIAKHAPNAFVIVITNPLDIMTQMTYIRSGLPANMVCGMAGVLDSARFAWLLAAKLGVAANDINAMVLGGHGDSMLPLISKVTVAGVPLQLFIDSGAIRQSEIDDIVQKVRDSGMEIIELLGHSAHYSTAIATIKMIQSYLFDIKNVMPCSTLLNGEYGISGTYVGVPVVIGRGGVEKVLELSLNNEEKKLFRQSALAIKNNVELLTKIK